jgi:integral membrane sensor domain MASE1
VKELRRKRAIVTAAVLAIIGLALMVWSVVDPRPLPVIMAMSVGQMFGVSSLALFGLVVFFDLRKAKVFEGDKPHASKPPETKEEPAS